MHAFELNGHRNADKRDNSFWQFLHFFSTELLVFLLCRQTGKEFRLPWPSFVRVEIYYKYRLPNRKYRLPASWIFHSEVVRAMTSGLRGHEFESRTIPFFFLIKIFFFISLFFLFSQFRSKTMWEFILKVRQYRICNGKASFFIFSKLLIPHVTARLDT